MAFGNLADQGKLVIDFAVRTFDLDDQERLAIGVTRFGEGFAGFDAGAVHEFDGNRHDARLNDVGHASARDGR